MTYLKCWGLFVIVLLMPCLYTSVTGLKCHCDFCPAASNETCETDGFCLSLTWLQRETNIIHHAFRCLDRKAFFPLTTPLQCTLSHVPNIAVRTACCATDMCNQNLTPELEPEEMSDDPHGETRRRPRPGTRLANKNASEGRTRNRRPGFNIVQNSTELDTAG